MGPELTGGCTCGDVRYELLSEPMFVHACHCHLCQRQTGSAFIIHAMIESDRIRLLSGELEATDARTGSGGVQQMFACRRCRVVVWNIYNGTTWLTFLRVGTLDDPSRCPPGAHIYLSSKLPWVTVPPGLPSFDEGYDMSAVWPPASYARKQAAEAAFEQSPR